MRAAKPRVALPLAAAMSEVYERALLLRLAQGEVSGDVLAQEAGLTRAAVWKRIAALREAGIRIDAVPGRGYTLRHPLELLDPARIREGLPVACQQQLTALDVAWSLDSTNSELLRRRAPAQGCAALLAERQTGGRGRRGRQWVSPLAAHVYLSLARCFEGGLARLGGLSLVTGIAACEALHTLGFTQVRLKWPNDLVVVTATGMHKLGGLLIEGAGEAAGTAHAVIGLGVNVRMPATASAAVSQAWVDLAGLCATPPSRNAVVATLLAHLIPALQTFDREGLPAFLSRYAACDALVGRAVSVHAAAGVWHAQALGIADDGALRVRDATGAERRVHAGDVSVRTDVF